MNPFTVGQSVCCGSTGVAMFGHVVSLSSLGGVFVLFDGDITPVYRLTSELFAVSGGAL